ncbi:MAG: YggS family pyridoxal phosphate-dependent enzyme [Salinibacterium sp.]|nr:YggS family pyridoxal phosphate-dependent enzyme [Salinibacterium sp.]
MSELAERLDAVTAGVTAAAALAGRDPGSITTIVVTKFHPAQLVRDLFDLGVREFGESRHQEAQPKIAELADLVGTTWHFIGQLQSKKARQVAAYAGIIHSFDRESLVGPLAGSRVFIQINLSDDPERGGVAPEHVEALAESALKGGLDVVGLMAIAPLNGEPRAAFARVREASERLVRTVPSATALSMGMSGDYSDAIMEGATHLRIGTAITGNRPTKG